MPNSRYYTIPQLEEKYKMSHAAVLSFVTRNKIPRITQGRMLNIDLVDNLYASLSKEQQQNLCSLLFKNSKQTMNYFRRTKDISLSKLETLADFFHLPLDYFRLGNSFATNNVNGNNNYIGNVSLSNNLLIENDSLRKEVESLKETLKAKDEALKAKDDLIQAKTDYIEALKAQSPSK